MIDLSNSTVMVAGGAGFVGSAIVRELQQHKCKIICFDNYLHGTPENVENLKDVVAVRGDALNELEIVRCMQDYKVEYVINCIGDTYVPSAYLWPRRFFNINSEACLNLLEACNICNIKRMLYISSTEVYGICDMLNIDESAPLQPVNTYAVSKLSADRLCYTHNIEHNTPVVIARIFNCYGPRESEPYIIPELIYQLNKGNILRLGNIHAMRDFTYVHDTARALIMVLQSEIENGDVVNVGSNNCYSVADIAEKLANIMNVKGIKIEIDKNRLRRCDIEKFQCNNSKLVSATGWQPQMDLSQGLARTVDWFYAQGGKWSWEAFVREEKMLK